MLKEELAGRRNDIEDACLARLADVLPPAPGGPSRGSERGLVRSREGCQWRALPRDLPPRSTCTTISSAGSAPDAGELVKLHHELYVQAREQADREARPTTAVVDSQSVKSAEGGQNPGSGGLRCRKEDQGAQTPRGCRDPRADARGGLLPANIQDRDGCLPVLKEVRRLFPFLQRIVADGGYQGANTAAAVHQAVGAPLEIVKRPDAAKGFVTLPKRWIVERTFGWLNRCRRLARDVEHRSRTHPAFVQIAMIRIMMRRLARTSTS